VIPIWNAGALAIWTKASDLIMFHLLVNGEAVGGANHDSSLMAGGRRKGFSGFSNLRLTIFST